MYSYGQLCSFVSYTYFFLVYRLTEKNLYYNEPTVVLESKKLLYGCENVQTSTSMHNVTNTKSSHLKTGRAMYLETYCNYRLEQTVYHRRTRQVTQLFTYLLTHKLFSSCIRRYLCHVPATEWCQRYLPCYLLSFSNSVCFSSIYRSMGRIRAISMALGRTSTAAYYWTISDKGRCRKLG